jgi:predicted lipoprotein with Yx(FWY)xxD motif
MVAQPRHADEHAVIRPQPGAVQDIIASTPKENRMSVLSFRRSLPAFSGVFVIGLLAAACSPAATTAPATIAPPAATSAPADTSAPAATTPAATTAGATGVVVNSATTSLGAVLVGPTGLTLYIHAGDSATSSTCTGGCATAWPPLTVPAGGSATGGTGVTGTFATLTRADGSVQVTYNGMPLYGWQGDSKPGDVTGNGINGFSAAKP